MKNRFLSLLLALVMLIGLVPTAVIPAFAAEESEEQPKVDSKGYILIWSYEQLVSVAQNARSNENYRLATDIYQTDNSNDLGILVRCDSLSLDLNGHVLSRETRSLDSALFFVCDGSTLNIYDTSPDSTGTCIYNNNYVSDTCSVINNSGGNVIINGGNYIVKMYNPSFKASVLYGTSGEFTVYDGYFDSTQASNGNAVNMHYSNSLYDEPNCTIYGGRFYSQRTCIEARSLANYSDVYYPYVFVLGGEFYTKRSNGDEYEGNFAYCNNGWGRVIAANGLVPARSLNARDQRYATGTTTTVETLTGEPGNGWKYATVTPPPRIVSEQLPKEDRWYSLCWRDYLKAAKENESYDFWTANQEAIEAELAKIDGFSVNIFDTEVTLSIEDKKEIDSVRWYVSASPYLGWTELVDYQNITGPVTQDPPKPGKTLYYRAVVTRKGGTEYEDIIYVNCEEPTEDVTPAFTTQPTGGTVVYNQRHIANWVTNFDPVKQELVRYSSAGNVVQIQELDAGAFQAGLSYMADGYYYRIRAYYNNSSYIESDKFYVTTDPYFTPNYEHGNTEGDIIEGITYVPNGDGTFNANVHVDLSYVDGQMLIWYWASTGYYWYDHNNKVNYGIGTTDTDKLVFTLYNLGENLEPGKEWKVKVYLADDPYADYEWRDVDFPYVTDTVPELKPEDVFTPAFTTQPKGGEVAPGEKLTVTWATNFTPVKTVLMKVVNHPVDGTVTTRETLGTASTAEVGAGYDYYFIRAYTETSYVDSNKFTVTEKKAESTIPAPAKPYKIANVVSGVHVYWKATEGATKYGLWRSETGVNGTYKWVANPTVPHFTDTKVESGKTYYYKVTAMNAAGVHSEKSAAIGIIYLSTPDITSRFNKAAGITLGWNKIQGATGYAIYRKSYSGTDAWVRVGTVSGNSTFTWQDTSVKNENGKVYKYTVRALAGSDMKTLSGCRNAGRTMARLTSRTLNSAVKASATSIKCSWTTSSAVTGYEVRFMIGDTVYKTFTVGNYKTGVKTFTGLKAGQTYKIQVRSYLKVDGMGFYSAWSEAKNVKI